MAGLIGSLVAGAAQGLAQGVQQNTPIALAQLQEEIRAETEARIHERTRGEQKADMATQQENQLGLIGARIKAEKDADPSAAALREAQTEQIRISTKQSKQQAELQKQREGAFDLANNDKAPQEERNAARKLYNNLTEKLNSMIPSEKTKIMDEFGNDKLADKRKSYDTMAETSATKQYQSPSEVQAAKAAGKIKTGDIINTPNGQIRVK